MASDLNRASESCIDFVLCSLLAFVDFVPRLSPLASRLSQLVQITHSHTQLGSVQPRKITRQQTSISFSLCVQTASYRSNNHLTSSIRSIEAPLFTFTTTTHSIPCVHSCLRLRPRMCVMLMRGC